MKNKKRVLALLLALSLAVSIAPIALADSEPNDSASDAEYIELGETIEGAIAESGDIDYYCFTLDSSGCVTLDVTAYMKYYSVIVYDDAATKLWYSDYNKYDSTMGYREDVHDIYLEAGDYYIQIKGSQSNSGSSEYTGTYTIATSFVDAKANEEEPNNSAATANEIELGNTLRGVLAESGDIDYFYFTLDKSGCVSLDVTAYMKYYSVIVYDDAATKLWYSDYNKYDSTMGYREDVHDIYLEAGDYYIQIKGSQSNSGSSEYTGTYTIKTSFTDADATWNGTNDGVSTAYAIDLDETVRGMIAVDESNDYYSISISNSMTVELNFTSYMEKYSAYIYDTSAKKVWSITDKKYDSSLGYRTDTDSITLSAGTYYFVVSSSYAGFYNFTLSSPDEAYTISVANSSNGTVTSNRASAANGTSVTLTVSPASGYELDEIYVLDSDGDEVSVTKVSETKYTFSMPSSAVTAYAVFSKTGNTSNTNSTNVTQDNTVSDTDNKNPFRDVTTGIYYYESVMWAVDGGITSGTTSTTFSPDASCTRAQAVTLLWRAAGSPSPASSRNPFSDVSSEDYYYTAVLWALEQGITSGATSTKFDPNGICTRSQIVTFMYRAAGSPSASGSSFKDVTSGDYYYNAVRWAVANGITSGTSTTAFSPDNACTRGQIVTFLYREYNSAE